MNDAIRENDQVSMPEYPGALYRAVFGVPSTDPDVRTPDYLHLGIDELASSKDSMEFVPTQIPITPAAVCTGVNYLDNPAAHIPEGPYCYRRGEMLTGPNGTPAWTVFSCPFMRHSNHGMVYCDYLKIGSVFNSLGAYEKALRHYGTEEKLEQASTSITLWDSCKECSVNDPDEPAVV